MYAVRAVLPSNEAYLRTLPEPTFEPILHVDVGVQVEESQLDLRNLPTMPTMLPGASSTADDDAELAGVHGSSSTATGTQLTRPSPHPRRSGGASPWLVGDDAAMLDDEGDDDDDDEDENEEDGEAHDGEGDSSAAVASGASSSDTGVTKLELTQVGFVAGHPNGELKVGSIGFYRYEEPAGVVGLRPPPLRSNVVCIPAVPSWLSSADLIHFFGGYARMVRHMRVLRDASMPHRHMVLLQFGSPSIAERFRADYHAKRFNSLEPEVALVVHVAAAVFAPPHQMVIPSSARSHAPEVRVRLHVNAPRLKCEACDPPGGEEPRDPAGGEASDPAAGAPRSTSAPKTAPEASAADPQRPQQRPMVRLQLWTSSAVDPMRALDAAARHPRPPLPPPSNEARAAVERAQRGRRATLPPLPLGALLSHPVELPSCPVCLERLDPSVTGIVTIVCDHSFHCECLRRWADSSCPVCRHVSDDTHGRTSCEVCGTLEALWICLVCGHVGCGRYTGCGSGLHHNEATGHNFALELSTQRVWDYSGDNYVHRLIQNKVDGKLVELPDPHGGGSSAMDGASTASDAARELKRRGQEEQYEAVVHEYSLLLTGQLEVQRRHYDERLVELERHHKRHLFELEEDIGQREEVLGRELELVKRESRASVKRVQSAETAIKERDFNKSLNEQLMRNLEALRHRLADSERREAELLAKTKDMEEQLRDLTFHFESQMKILQGGIDGELVGAEVAGVAPPPQTPREKLRKAKARGSG